jgi:hypothetical protein
MFILEEVQYRSFFREDFEFVVRNIRCEAEKEREELTGLWAEVNVN